MARAGVRASTPSAFWATRLPASRASTTGTTTRDEMADALKRLARLIEQIVDGEAPTTSCRLLLNKIFVLRR